MKVIVYGKNVAIGYLEQNKDINKIYLLENFNDQNIISLIKKYRYNHVILNKNDFSKIARGNHQGIIVDVASQKPTLLEDVIKDQPDIIVMLDHIEDPHNLGAIARTCEAAGIKNIIIPNKRSAGIDGVVAKTSAGTIDKLEITVVSNLRDALAKLKSKGYWIIGTEMDAKQTYYEQDYKGKIVIIIGNEGKGISPIIKNECDYLIKIPMYGNVNSLNASVAAGIIIFEAIKSLK